MRLLLQSILCICFLSAESLISQVTGFGSRIDMGLVENDAITEASGVACSRIQSGLLWTHNDSGDRSRLFAMSIHGKHLAEVHLTGVKSIDWEDICIGPGPEEGREYVYIADIGDNNLKREIKTIYRIPEPVIDANTAPVTLTLSGADVLRFRYPDGNHNAETIMVDPILKDIYLVTKKENSAGLYRIRYTQSNSNVIDAEHVATYPYTLIVAGDISPDGTEILLKNYFFVYHFRRDSTHTVRQALGGNASVIPYVPEPQGEAIGWDNQSRGFYTLSEELGGIPAHLYFYPKIPESSLKNNPSSKRNHE
jgi:hypothetical protein